LHKAGGVGRREDQGNVKGELRRIREEERVRGEEREQV